MGAHQHDIDDGTDIEVDPELAAALDGRGGTPGSVRLFSSVSSPRSTQMSP